MNNDYQKHIDGVCDLFDSRKILFIEKNKNYGCSYLKSAEILKFILEDKELNLNTSGDHAAYQLITRMMDKIIRFCTLRFTEQNDSVNESIIDTAADLSVYAAMLSEIEKNPLEQKKKTKVTL
jgi:hypothetical protein